MTEAPVTLHSGIVLRSMEASGLAASTTLIKTSPGAVIRQAVRQDGLLVSQTLTELPQWALRHADPTVLPTQQQWSTRSNHPEVQYDTAFDTEKGVKLQIVLNRGSQAFQEYTISRNADGIRSDSGDGVLELPLVLERHMDTAPTFIGRGHFTLESGTQVLDGGEQSSYWQGAEDSHRRKRAKIANGSRSPD